MKRSYGLAGRESGQGTIEYVLILVIMVILILSLVYRFQSAFRGWATAYFGDYIACLLEVGELPGTGSVCKDEFAAYDPSKGKGLLKDTIPEGGGGSGKGANAATAANANKKAANRSEGEVIAPNDNATVGRFGQDDGRARSTEIGAVGDKDAGEPAPEKSGLDEGTSIGSFGHNYRPDRTRMEFGSGDLDDEDDVAKKGKPKVASAGNTNDSHALRPKSFSENIERKPAAIPDIDGGSMSFGGLIRLLFIICIIIAIVVFFGGQLMSIMKSREKGGD